MEAEHAQAAQGRMKSGTQGPVIVIIVQRLKGKESGESPAPGQKHHGP